MLPHSEEQAAAEHHEVLFSGACGDDLDGVMDTATMLRYAGLEL